MTILKKGMIIDVNLNPTQGSETGKVRPCIIVTNDVYNERIPVIQVVPITEWSTKKNRIKTNVELYSSQDNGLSKKSIADCLQTRPIDHRHRMVKVRGTVSHSKIQEINQALRIVFELNFHPPL